MFVDVHPGAKIFPLAADGTPNLTTPCHVVDGAEHVGVVDEYTTHRAFRIIKMDDGEEYLAAVETTTITEA